MTKTYARVEARYPPELIERLRTLYSGGMTQEEVAATMGLTAMIVRRLMKKHEIPVRPAIRRDQRGEKNHMWKGDQVGYAAAHERVVRARGKPTRCEHCGTTRRNCEWASITGDYANVEDYKSLCGSCHARYDNIVANLDRRT